jgi:hypothetical protein
MNKLSFIALVGLMLLSVNAVRLNNDIQSENKVMGDILLETQTLCTPYFTTAGI